MTNLQQIAWHSRRLQKIESEYIRIEVEWRECFGKRGAPLIRRSLQEDWDRLTKIRQECCADLRTHVLAYLGEIGVDQFAEVWRIDDDPIVFPNG